ncbi:MAG: rod-binding protein, partial [Glaciimonas sp.]|nr:rod-binding protein [Glaciimonas sp.]
MQSVDALRRTAKTSPEEGIKQVSRQFEAMFMQIVLKSMREAMPTEGGMFDTQTTKQFTSMLDQ